MALIQRYEIVHGMLMYMFVYTCIYADIHCWYAQDTVVVVPRNFHPILTALRRIVLMLTWRTVGMHVPSSFSSAICVQRMQESQRTAPTKLVQVYTCIYVYIRVYLGFTCISWVVCQLRQLKIECNFVQAHRHESQARGVETLRRHKAQRK
jgi:hypothetical protein